LLYFAILNRIAKYSNSFCEYLQLDPFILSTPVEFDRFTAIRKNVTPAPGFRRDRVAGVQNRLLLLDSGFRRNDRERYLPNSLMDLIDAAPTHLARLKQKRRVPERNAASGTFTAQIPSRGSPTTDLPSPGGRG